MQELTLEHLEYLPASDLHYYEYLTCADVYTFKINSKVYKYFQTRAEL